MRFGLDIGTAGAWADPQVLTQLAREAEAAGWDGFFLWDLFAAEDDTTPARMHFEPTHGRSREDRPHTHHLRQRGDHTTSIEAPGTRRPRGLAGLDDAPGRGRHRRPDAHGHGRRGLHSRRGAIREATLALLAEQPMHGYQVMQELGERSGGRWRPSAGSVYPTLQQLEDEGLVTVEDRDGRRTFALTEAGRTAAQAIPADRPWTRGQPGDDLGGLARELGIAAIQVNGVGTPAAQAAARSILTDARRSLYRLLADDGAPTT